MPHSTAPLALLRPASGHLRTPDLLIIGVYLLAITIFGLRFRPKNKGGKPDRSLKGYFLAGNTIPWWAISLSVVSAETSTLTIVSIPGVAFAGDFGFLQIVVGYLLGRVVVALLFLPRYFAGEMLTAYQLIDRRFGPVLHKVTAGLFLLTRAAAEGVRVFAVSIVVGIAIGTGDILSIAIISALTLLYTFEGGLAAVIWTDVVQMAIYVGGTLVALLTLGHHVAGGWPAIAHTASHAGKFHMFNFALNLTQSYTFWAGVLGGTFLTMASHGTDQLMVQRLLAARNLRESQLALLSSGVVIFAQFAFFLLIGAGLWVFYGQRLGPHAAAAFRSNDYIFPTYIVREMPVGIAGLLVAAILAAAMSNLSAALNSLSSTTVVDFYMRFRQPHRAAQLTEGRATHSKAPNPGAPCIAQSHRAMSGVNREPPEPSDRERLLVSKASTALWAIVLFAIAVYSVRVGGKGHVVEIGLSIAAVAYGCLLGVFLLGTLTRFATEYGATAGMVCGFALNLWLWQGTFPVHLGPLTIPHIAFTWYVLIGAAVTFAIGSLASLVFRRTATRRPAAISATTTTLLLLFLLSFPQGICVSPAQAQTPAATPSRPASSGAKVEPTNQPGAPFIAQSHRAMSGDSTDSPNFTLISTLINTAIAEHKLPGAVVVIGHGGAIAFEHAYGNRKLPGEPGPNGQPSPAEPMTEDTIFDMASLTKCIVTATAIGQLYEQGKLDFDTPLDQYLPEFNPTHDPARAKVTLRLLLTHFSGEPPDVDLKDAWGLASPNKAEGLRRALNTPLQSAPGATFRYSDINFILLGALVEKLSGEPLDDYAQEQIFRPVGMAHTQYHSFAKACGTHAIRGSAIFIDSTKPREIDQVCRAREWFVNDIFDTAPTAHDDEGTPATNPDFNHLLRGTVHDPTTRRMGGVAGHAGVFSTARDMSLFAQALLDRLAGRPSDFPLKRLTLELMTTPEQPGHTPFQIGEAFRANQAAISAGQKPATGNPALLDPNFPAIPGQTLRGFGWDIDSVFSKPRGRLPLGSFGHTGFTGTSLWLDPYSDTYVLLLANAIHPHPGAPISNLRGEVATAAAEALGLYTSQNASSRPEAAGRSTDAFVLYTSQNASSRPEAAGRSTDALVRYTSQNASSRPEAAGRSTDALGLYTSQNASSRPEAAGRSTDALVRYTSQNASSRPEAAGRSGETPVFAPAHANGVPDQTQATLTGLDILESTHFATLVEAARRRNNQLHLGLLTNQTGLDTHGRRTVDILATDLPKAVPGAKLTTLFSPEHGIFGRQDTEHLATETDPTTGLHVTSLYGPHDADKRPSHEQLKDLDAVVIDLQDAGVRCYTYETVLGYFLEAAAAEKRDHHHDLQILVLDRPDPIGGDAIEGPLSDPGAESYINYMPLPLRHGLTLGELARYINATKQLGAHLTVVPMQGWHRAESFDQTGLPWVDPSPNLRSPTAETLYPATAFLELTNLSVGRGTATPFELFGAGSDAKTGTWFQAKAVAAALNARSIPGVRFEATPVPITEDANHYPFHGQTIEAVRVILTDRTALQTSELGLELLNTLHMLYPAQFQLEKAMRLVANRATIDAIARGDDPRSIAASWQPALARFRAQRAPWLLYPAR